MTQEQTWSLDGEYFAYDSLEELLDNYGDAISYGSTVYVGDKVDASKDTLRLVDADDIIDMMSERAWDNFGECAEDYPIVSEEARQELNDMLKGWTEKHCKPSFYWIKNVREYVVTEEDVKNAN
jgi:hypothetical protein